MAKSGHFEHLDSLVRSASEVTLSAAARTQLAFVRTLMDVIRRDPEPEASAALLEQLCDESARLARLIMISGGPPAPSAAAPV